MNQKPLETLYLEKTVLSLIALFWDISVNFQ